MELIGEKCLRDADIRCYFLSCEKNKFGFCMIKYIVRVTLFSLPSDRINLKIQQPMCSSHLKNICSNIRDISLLFQADQVTELFICYAQCKAYVIVIRVCGVGNISGRISNRYRDLKTDVTKCILLENEIGKAYTKILTRKCVSESVVDVDVMGRGYMDKPTDTQREIAKQVNRIRWNTGGGIREKSDRNK